MCFDVYDKEEDEVTQTDSYSFWKLTIVGYMGKELYNIHSGLQLWGVFRRSLGCSTYVRSTCVAVIAPLSRHEIRVAITSRLARHLALADGASLVRDWELGERKRAVSGETSTLTILTFNSMDEYILVQEYFSKSEGGLLKREKVKSGSKNVTAD